MFWGSFTFYQDVSILKEDRLTKQLSSIWSFDSYFYLEGIVCIDLYLLRLSQVWFVFIIFLLMRYTGMKKRLGK